MGFGSAAYDAKCAPCPAGQISRGGLLAQCVDCGDYAWNNDFASACSEPAGPGACTGLGWESVGRAAGRGHARAARDYLLTRLRSHTPPSCSPRQVCISGTYGRTDPTTGLASCAQCPTYAPVSLEGSTLLKNCTSCPLNKEPSEDMSMCGEPATRAPTPHHALASALSWARRCCPCAKP
jgi:hypothetical protein